MVPPRAFTVIVNTWLAPTALVPVAGVMLMLASTQVLFALPLPPAVVFAAVPVVRVIVAPPTGMPEVADTTVVPVAAEVIVTVQLAVAAPPVYVQLAGPTKLPGPLTIDAVAVCGPASIVPPRAFTVIVNTWFVPTAFVAVAGAIWMLASAGGEHTIRVVVVGGVEAHRSGHVGAWPGGRPGVRLAAAAATSATTADAARAA